jgi:hypothetical protein
MYYGPSTSRRPHKVSIIKKDTNLGYGFNMHFSRNGKVSAFGMKENSPSNF